MMLIFYPLFRGRHFSIRLQVTFEFLDHYETNLIREMTVKRKNDSA